MRRILAAAMAALAVAALACAPPTPTLTAASRVTPTVTPRITPAAGERLGTVQRVVDGDTFDIAFPGGATDRVRILGVDTPEKARNRADEYPGITDTACLDRWGQRATEFSQAALAGRSVALETDPAAGDRDVFGRILAYVRTDSGDFSVSLLEGGYARVYTEGRAARESAYLAVQQGARAGRAGLWSCAPAATPVTPGATTGGMVIASVDRAGEVVVIENRGAAPSDLAGWVLVSEVGDQRFTFPSLALQPGGRVQVTSGRNAVDDPPRSLRWTGSAVWNDGGDPAVLLDAGGTEVSRHP